MEVNSFQIVLIDITFMALTCLKGGTECDNIIWKNPIKLYSAPAVKGLIHGLEENAAATWEEVDWVLVE